MAGLPATIVHHETRCQAMFACWIYRNQFEIGPVGWTFERVEVGHYIVYPNPADVPDPLRAIALCGLHRYDPLRAGPPAARTFAVNCTPEAFEIYIFINESMLADHDCALFVLVPG